MIRSMADLLSEFLDIELPKLDSHSVTHGPTIGDMYEGLSEEILARGLPRHLQLRVVTGFATDGTNRSGQIDRMLVRGDGEPIPYTGAFVWHVRDIIAVVEVKKTLKGAELAESIALLATVKSLELNNVRQQAERWPDLKIDASPALRSFAQVTGRLAPDRAELYKLELHDQQVYHTLLLEQFSVLRIAYGFHGYATEAGLRSGFIKLLRKTKGSRGFGPSGLPQLIVSGDFALVKANGNPYSAPMVDGHWPFFFSASASPLLLLLEMIWTRLDHLFGLGNPWGNDLELEAAHPLLLGRGTNEGWNVEVVEASTAQLASAPSHTPWEPAFLTDTEFVIFAELCEGRRVSLSDGELIEFLAKRGLTPAQLRDRLLRTHLVALDGDELLLNAIECGSVILADGRIAVAENNTGRLTRWALAYESRRRGDSDEEG